MKKFLLVLTVFISSFGFSQTLELTANTCFFSPVGTLWNLNQTVVDDPYNGNRSFEVIGLWREKDDTIVWGLENLAVGGLDIEIFLSIATLQDGNLISIFLDDEEQELEVTATADLDEYISQGTVHFDVLTPGTHEVKLKIKTQTGTDNYGEIQKLVLNGSATTGANVWERRWRPAAAHSKFISDNDLLNTEIAVYEINVVSSYLNSYQVMTTEFGYIGSPISDGKVSGLNFSLWSFGADDPSPPHPELSHLIAVSGEGSIFGMFDHEGTGVKPRGFDPFAEADVSQFTVAIRKVPNGFYNTYWCYVLDPITEHWRLYGCGKSIDTDGDPDYLERTGGFLEIAGPSYRERSGHRKHIAEFRGWRMQSDGTWDVIDEMDPAYYGYDISYKEWSVNEAGNKFVLANGGFQYVTDPDPGIMVLPSPSATPFYLEGTYLEELYTMPANFTVVEPIALSESEAVVKYAIQDLGPDPVMTLYYGSNYGLTEGIFENELIDSTWEYSIEVPIDWIEGDTLINIPISGLDYDADYYYRLRVENGIGITWAYDTDTLNVSELELVIDDSGIDQNELNAANFAVYPNPVSDNLISIWPVPAEQLAYTIFDASGRMVQDGFVAGEGIDVTELVVGQYIVKLMVSEKEPVVLKFIRE